MASLAVLLPQIKDEIGAVGKTEKNAQQGFNFRGIDNVVNAVAPVFIQYGVTIIPNVRSYDFGSVEVGSRRTPMSHVRLVVEFTLIGPDDDRITGSAAGEAMDSGDKATAKAESVALRTFLLQALSLPTTEMDPDAVTYERTDTAALAAAVQRVQAAWMQGHGGELDMAALSTDYAARGGGDIRIAGIEALDAYAAALGAPPAPPVPGVQEHLQRATEKTEAKA